MRGQRRKASFYQSRDANRAPDPYVRNKARLAGQPGSEPRSPASWPKVGLKPLAVADPPPSAKPCCSPAFNYKKGPARGGSMARGGAAQACARVVCPALWRMLS